MVADGPEVDPEVVVAREAGLMVVRVGVPAEVRVAEVASAVPQEAAAEVIVPAAPAALAKTGPLTVFKEIEREEAITLSLFFCLLDMNLLRYGRADIPRPIFQPETVPLPFFPAEFSNSFSGKNEGGEIRLCLTRAEETQRLFFVERTGAAGQD